MKNNIELSTNEECNIKNENKISVFTEQDYSEFKKYLDAFLKVVNNSKGHVDKDKNGNNINNSVVGGTLEKVKLPSGFSLGKKYAAIGNRLYKYPYVNNQDWVNLYFDWKPEHFPEPTLFVTIPNEKKNMFKYKFEKPFVLASSKKASYIVYGYQAISTCKNIDYKGLLEAMYELTYKKGNKEMRSEDNEIIAKRADLLKESKNIILRGAPGTGKTYMAQQIAAFVISEGKTTQITDLTIEQQKQLGFVQFHPSYDYTDFVEGLRPTTSEDGSVSFTLKRGSFMSFVEKAKASKSVGGKDNFEEAWQKFFATVSESSIEANRYDKLKTLRGKPIKNILSYERNGMQGVYPEGTTMYWNHDQIYNVYRGLPGVPKEGLDNYRKAIVEHLKNEYGLEKYVPAVESSTNSGNYVFIIDEINRGEISKIFGELFFSIDPGYRSCKEGVYTQYANLHENPEEKFYVPENVYIIGTMNDIDRSVDTFDFAMRRRFTFLEVTAEESAENMHIENDVKTQMARLNSAIINVGELTDDYQIGASYFKDIHKPEIDKMNAPLWSTKLYPLLKDYFRGERRASEKLENIKKEYFDVQEN